MKMNNRTRRTAAAAATATTKRSAAPNSGGCSFVSVSSSSSYDKNDKQQQRRRLRRLRRRFRIKSFVHFFLGFAVIIVIGCWLFLLPFSTTTTNTNNTIHTISSSSQQSQQHPPPPPQQHQHQQQKQQQQTETTRTTKKETKISPVWNDVLTRAKAKHDYCKSEDHNNFVEFDNNVFEMKWGNSNKTLPTLPAFGIINDLESYIISPFKTSDTNSNKYNNDDDNDNNIGWPQCQLPPETECNETQLTVIIMAYNPDRIEEMFQQIQKFIHGDNFQFLVKEVVLVWNGPREINESPIGQRLLDFEVDEGTHNKLRIVYPLKLGLPNDLMNRYHPQIVGPIKTKCILYYDDDGPFYKFKAVEAGFELWKRNSRVQIGAMARQINYNDRQQNELSTLLLHGDTTAAVHSSSSSSNNDGGKENDRLFVSHCDNLQDKVEYNFYYFANYNANMVLPSGSMLHSDYLCHLWHPVLQNVRCFVLQHPVHPDDITVSTVVSHLAGQAPKVYSRRLNPQDTNNNNSNNKLLQREEEAEAQQQRNILEEKKVGEDDDGPTIEYPEKLYLGSKCSGSSHELNNDGTKGAGIGGIRWDRGQGMTAKKQIWADLRSQAINALIRYFGSINSGSIGWCEGTQYYNPKKKDGKCDPIMAKQGWLPWMKPNGERKDTCP